MVEKNGILTDPPPLFAGIKLGVTTKDVTWTTILTARLIAGDGGMVAIGCGEGEKFGPLKHGTNLQGAFLALFGKMWDHPPLSDLSKDHDRFLLIAHSVKATYDHMARKMELLSRLIIYQTKTWANPTARPPSQPAVRGSSDSGPKPAPSSAPSGSLRPAEPAYPPPRSSTSSRSWANWSQWNYDNDETGAGWNDSWRGYGSGNK